MSSSREKPKFETLWTVRSQAGEPTSVICVRNLQATSCIVGTDAWGRQLKYQPLVISAEASLSQPFASSSAEDAVGEDTIHYGHMSKCILDALRYIAEKGTGTTSVGDAVDIICDSLTGMRVDGGEGFVPWDKKQRPLLKPQSLASLSVTISLPKATRCGEGISLTGMSLFNERKVVMYGRCLRLHRLRVPTLIGVNEHERKARQTVVADVEIERYDTWPQGGGFNSVEDAIESTMATSTFATLEALALCLHDRIKKLALEEWKGDQLHAGSINEWQVRIRLEKPVAVPLADGAVVEYMAPISTEAHDIVDTLK